MPQRTKQSTPPSNVELRTTLSPTQFTSLILDGLGLDQAVEQYFDWMEGVGTHKRRRRFRACEGIPSPLNRESILEGEVFHGGKNSEITARRDGESVLLRFIHRDSRYQEVFWYSIVRIRGVNKNSQPGVSIEHGTGRSIPQHLQSTPIARPVAGAPAILRDICKLNGVRPRSQDLLENNEVDIPANHAGNFVRHILLKDDRQVPCLVVSSCKENGDFLVDPNMLRKMLAMQVTVATLRENSTREFQKVFEENGHSSQLGVCFNGAVRLYHPGIDKMRNPRTHYLWLPDRIQGLGPRARATKIIAGEIAERVTWRTIPSRFFAIIDDFDRAHSRRVTEELLQREILKSADATQKAVDLETLVEELREQLKLAQNENANWQEEAAKLEKKSTDDQQLLDIAVQENNDTRLEYDTLRARIANLEGRVGSFSETQMDALRSFAHDRKVHSISDAILLIETLYPDRIVLLQSARKSAEESTAFNKPDKVWDLIYQLATCYWETVQDGGDAAGRKCFSTNNFAPRESGTVESRASAMKHRTFQYNGDDLVMWKHLKIGKKDSVAETWRCHFEFDANAKKIVIGHCGKHLPFK